MKRELPRGYAVEYRHAHGARRLVPDRLRGQVRHAAGLWAGSSTLAVISNPDDSVVSIGVAYCRPGDQFSKRLGRTIALGRALKALAAEHDGMLP